ncbi:MAG: PAS domain-containing protein [Woeseia sp.]
MHRILQLFELSRDLMCVAGTDGYFKQVNPAFRDVLGYTNSELTEVPFLELVHPADRAATEAEMAKLRSGQSVLRFENRYRCKDGSFKVLAWVSVPQVNENLIYAIARDVTDSRQSLNDLMRDLPGVVYRCKNDGDWTMSFISHGCFNLTGYTADDFLDQKSISYDSIVHPDDRERLHQDVQSAIDGQYEFQLEYRIITASGEEKVVCEKGRAIHVAEGTESLLQGYIFDISDRRKLRDELIQLQRMEALGQMTGGIAHDFNNLLTVVSGNLQLLEKRVAENTDQFDMVRDALAAAWRGAELCQRLLAFGRRQVLQPELTAINELVGRVKRMLRLSLREGIEVEFSLREGLPDVIIDQGQLENAILNLAINARDAMPDGGSLHIHTDMFKAGAAYAQLHPDVDAGDYVQIEVSDSGTGMSAEVRDRAFEPFFTTKEPGRGTGLGLSMVYGLLKQSGGYARLYSEPGHGTSVKLFVPVPKADDPVLTDTMKFAALSSTPRGNERILVVEDDDEVCKMVVKMLNEFGYETVSAENAEIALKRLEEAERDFDLLFTDVIMPGEMDGVALAQQAIQSKPALKVLLTSGFSKHRLNERGNFALLNKPYHEKQLADAVRQVLDS